jgi:hypothetical protein
MTDCASFPTNSFIAKTLASYGRPDRLGVPSGGDFQSNDKMAPNLQLVVEDNIDIARLTRSLGEP